MRTGKRQTYSASKSSSFTLAPREHAREVRPGYLLSVSRVKRSSCRDERLPDSHWRSIWRATGLRTGTLWKPMPDMASKKGQTQIWKARAHAACTTNSARDTGLYHQGVKARAANYRRRLKYKTATKVQPSLSSPQPSGSSEVKGSLSWSPASASAQVVSHVFYDLMPLWIRYFLECWV